MFEQHRKRHIVDILFVLALFCVFSISALTLVTIGADVYKRTADSMTENYSNRTAFAYVTEKIRQNDSSLGVHTTTLHGIDTLILAQSINDENYSNYIYMHEGYLKEILVKSHSIITLDMLAAGQKILEINEFSLSKITENILTLNIAATEGDELTLYVNLRN